MSVRDTITIRNSPIGGKGVFASRDINKGTLICRMLGKKISVTKLKLRYISGKVKDDYPFQISDRIYVLLNNPYIFINHSCNPNAGIRGAGELIAIREIRKGQEITYDYSTTEWEDDEAWGINWYEQWRMPCKCGSKKCRKVITTFPASPKSMQMRYYRKKMLPRFVMNKLNNGKSISQFPCHPHKAGDVA